MIRVRFGVAFGVEFGLRFRVRVRQRFFFFLWCLKSPRKRGSFPSFSVLVLLVVKAPMEFLHGNSGFKNRTSSLLQKVEIPAASEHSWDDQGGKSLSGDGKDSFCCQAGVG